MTLQVLEVVSRKLESSSWTTRVEALSETSRAQVRFQNHPTFEVEPKKKDGRNIG